MRRAQGGDGIRLARSVDPDAGLRSGGQVQDLAKGQLARGPGPARLQVAGSHGLVDVARARHWPAYGWHRPPRRRQPAGRLREP